MVHQPCPLHFQMNLTFLKNRLYRRSDPHHLQKSQARLIGKPPGAEPVKRSKVIF
jgi:hypothetical protein